MIPKKIHYCWFGGKKFPPLVKKCIESWKKFCPDYEIIEWNETNFDINYNTYVKQAYEQKKWAFVADVARLYALYNYGGIYMDTDVEVVSKLDLFLKEKSFCGFEAVDRIQTGILACEKGHKMFKHFLDYYNDRTFIDINGNCDITTNVKIITNELLKYGLKLDNSHQIVNDISIYPTDFFCPFDYETRKLKKTKNTYVIHWFDGSWVPKSQILKAKFLKSIKMIIGKKNYDKIKKMMKK